MSREIIMLSQLFVRDNIDRFLEIDKSTIGEKWNSEHFVLNIPGKWIISMALLIEGNVIAFLIASQKNTTYHIHRLVVDESLKGKGFGKLLINELVIRAKKKYIRAISLKVHRANLAAIDFYLKMNFLILKSDEVNFYLELDLDLDL